MDLWNNGVGITYGQTYNPSSESEMATTVLVLAVFQGELRYLSPLDFDNYNRGIIPGATQLIPTNQ